ncbi:Serine/threonine protein kinase [Phytophthora megakarya]|uniref:Serine/threonine protein kinase n=1 Tax=Phytophthora megakarya TaxID=4795 RepID=A0A225UPL1_9STRA|nr:Serine/threonine protein kinase [Phytophthora megakarya]
MYGLCESVEPNAESLVTGIKTHVVSDGNTIMNVLDKVDKLLSTTSVTTSEYHGVYIRVRDLMNQFDEYQEPLPAKLVASYSSIVWRLYQTLGDMVEDECSCSIQPSVMRANLINGFNLDIDEIMGSGVGILRASELHSWRSFLWKSHKHCDLTLKTDAIHLNWLDSVPRDHSTLYIPRTHIQRTHWIGKGAFGSVYYAKWLGTNVVMKQIETNQAEKDNQNKFFQETELWLTLNHKHLVHLYGVDDSEQRPFFICERATCGTLTQSEIGDSRLRECLIDAALGLENLHESGIAHGDLKGDNILVCWDWLVS